MSCPFVMYRNEFMLGVCRLQVKGIEELKYTFDGEHRYYINYFECVGEDKCPIITNSKLPKNPPIKTISSDLKMKGKKIAKNEKEWI